MNVDALQGMTVWAEPSKDMVNRDKTVLAKGQFSTMLRQLETGGGITDTGESSGEDTTTVIRVMSDGSVLITVYEGDKLVSQTKTHAAHPDKIPTILSTQVEKSTPDKAQEQLTASKQATQMLNMLLQK
ncbi:hypothetical protein [Selenomonas ruminantium]|uniref:Uncharacterized protein n=1 Tax=Selenomonas ruminantium TaxID=971 RepID=A0A1H3YUL0_SELRU|nr:hypothetical protein [Selenomonas ruminantium]SEA15100.1 hypothetical protein SAMN05660648_02137 [Selenomonas ruminantium]